MNKLLMLSALLFAIGVVCFGISGHFYWTMKSMQDTFAYYGMSEQGYLANPEVAEALWNLRLGTIQFIVGGVTFWIVSIILLFKGKKSTK